MEQNLDITKPALFNEILVITSTIRKPKRKIYPDITNKRHAEQTNSDQNPLIL